MYLICKNVLYLVYTQRKRPPQAFDMFLSLAIEIRRDHVPCGTCADVFPPHTVNDEWRLLRSNRMPNGYSRGDTK